tara:strand:- start:151 stop:441 length:291 start_codon:yes stop_codon:yes gene_type:complete
MEYSTVIHPISFTLDSENETLERRNDLLVGTAFELNVRISKAELESEEFDADTATQQIMDALAAQVNQSLHVWTKQQLEAFIASIGELPDLTQTQP